MRNNDKEKLVRELLETYENGNARHKFYKSVMKKIIYDAFSEFYEKHKNNEVSEKQLVEWIDEFVEEKFTPKK